MTEVARINPVGGQVELRQTEVQHRTVRYRCVANGPLENLQNGDSLRLPILLLHGLAGSGSVWIRTLRELSNLNAPRPLVPFLIAPDMPGFGLSAGPPQSLTMDELADWVICFLDTQSLEKVHIAANSMGCQVALAVARRFPERVGALVLTGPTVGQETVPAWRYLAGALTNSSGEPIVFRLMALQMFLQMGLRRYVGTFAQMMSDSVVREAGTVAAPCLIVRGAKDRIASEESAQTLAAALPNAAYTTIADAAHVTPFNSAARFSELLVRFCAQIEAGDLET